MRASQPSGAVAGWHLHKEEKPMDKVPDHILKHQPRRDQFQSQEEYEEALAYFKHRMKPRLKASQPPSASR